MLLKYNYNKDTSAAAQLPNLEVFPNMLLSMKWLQACLKQSRDHSQAAKFSASAELQPKCSRCSKNSSEKQGKVASFQPHRVSIKSSQLSLQADKRASHKTLHSQIDQLPAGQGCKSTIQAIVLCIQARSWAVGQAHHLSMCHIYLLLCHGRPMYGTAMQMPREKTDHFCKSCQRCKKGDIPTCSLPSISVSVPIL